MKNNTLIRLILLAGCLLTTASYSMQEVTSYLSPIDEAAQVYDGFKKYIDDFNQPVTWTFTTKKGLKVTKTLNVKFAFLPHWKEALWEGLDLRVHSKKQNLPKFQQIAEHSEIDEYADPDNVLVMSIGSSSAQGSYINTSGQIEPLQYLFGTDASPDKDRLVNKMIDDWQRLGKKVALANSISFVEIDGVTAGSFETYNLKKMMHSGKKFSLQGKAKNAGELANLIMSKMKSKKITVDVLIVKADKADKLGIKWTKTMVLSQKYFGPNTVGYADDAGGKGCSGKYVKHLSFNDTENCVVIYNGDKSDEYSQADFVSWFKSGLASFYIHGTLKHIKLLLVSSAERDIEARYETDEDVRIQDNYPVIVFQTGQARELYYDTRAFLGLDPGYEDEEMKFEKR